jgi:MFS family permease
MRASIRPAAPTHAHRWVIFFTVTLAILAYVDRVAVSQAGPVIAREMHFDKAQMGTVFGAFILGYALFEIPGAWLADWLGPRKALIRIVAWWSAFTAFTGMAGGFRSLIAIRFLFGAGEAGAFPTIAKSLSTWLPVKERTRVQGLLWTATHWSGAVTPPLIIFLLGVVSWRGAFGVLGAAGILWLIPFAFWYRDNPAKHPAVNAAELALLPDTQQQISEHQAVPWRELLQSNAVRLLALQYFCLWFSGYFYITWLPTYLQEFHKLTPSQSANYTALPLFTSGLGALFSGFFTTRLAGFAGGTLPARRMMVLTGFLGSALFMALSIPAGDPRTMIAMMAIANFCHDLVMPPAWATCMDIGGRFSGSVAGIMNLFGNLAGVASSTLGGYMLQSTGSNWHMLIGLLAAVYALGALCWLRLDSVSPVVGPQRAPTPAVL